MLYPAYTPHFEYSLHFYNYKRSQKFCVVDLSYVFLLLHYEVMVLRYRGKFVVQSLVK